MANHAGLAVVAMEVKQFHRNASKGLISYSTSSQDIKLHYALFTCASVMRLHVLPSFLHLQLRDLIFVKSDRIVWFIHRTKCGKGSNWAGTSSGAKGDMLDELLRKVKSQGYIVGQIVMDHELLPML